MKNLTADIHDHDPKEDQSLYDLLVKLSEEETETADNEDEPVPGTPQADDPGEERSSGDIDAPWGEEPPAEVVQFSRQAFTEFKRGREGLLKRYFAGTKEEDRVNQKVVDQQLSHAASGDYETSSPQLSEQAKKGIGA